MDEPIMRVPPNNADAERSVLGCMMQDREALGLAFEMLTADDFYQPAHREIFDAMHALNVQGMPIDLVTVDDELTRRGTLEGVGGSNYLVELSQCVASTVNARAYLQIVDEKATLRRMIRATGDISSACYAQTDPIADILGTAEKSIFDIIMRRHEGSTLRHIGDVLPDTYIRIEKLVELKGSIDGVPMGFVDLDNLLTGLHGGELVIVGARPSMGKSAFGLNIAGYAAMHAGRSVAYFSLEMPNDQLAMRLLCSDARVDMQSVRHGTIRDEDWLSLAATLGPLAASNIYMDDTSGITPSQLRSRCRRLKMERGLDLVIVDYLQLMSADGHVENRQNEVSEISRNLKSIAKELNVPLVALAQLSRAGAQRSDKRPILSDLRDSGAIEQDADVIMFLHREEYYDPNTEDKNIAEVIVAKQRNGPLGTVKLAWLGQYTRFASLQQAQGA
ncbi:MAG: replicative DNA helicase [Clostridiales bacterium]|nr:replicative DNA helicase [Clostridiales bacterium]MDY5350516.1 replicative DNA helicase [Candidatus Ventricola sp.]MDY5513155.1 replicative DNA helicase [Candidatus Ventricola sp.]